MSETDTLETVDPGDPFADEDAPTVPPEAEGDIPTVDREGNPVQDQPITRADENAARAAKAAEAAATPEPVAEAATDEPVAEAAAAPESAPEAAQTAEEPPGVEEAKPAAAPESFRAYEALMQTGPNQWTEVPLEGKPGTQVIDGKTWLMARNADHARRQLWPIIGRPDQGATIVAVAKSSWSPKRVKARQVPTRESLEIS